MKTNMDGNELEVDKKDFETWKNMTREVVYLVLLAVSVCAFGYIL